MVVLSLVLMTVDHRHHHLQEVRSWLSSAVYPIQYVADLPVRLSAWTGEQFSTHQSLVAQNRALQEENLLLRSRMLRFEALESENTRLRELLDTAKRLREQVVIAQLLSVDLDPFRQQVVLDKGSRHQVYAGQPLINAAGVVGQVLEVHPLNSVALLISDPSHALPVQVNRTGLRTLAMGTGNPERLDLRFIPPSEDIRRGDIISTSGLGGRFPADYPVAQVTRVERPSGESFAQVEARPLARLDRSREVLLLWPAQPDQDPNTPAELAPPEDTEPPPEETGEPDTDEVIHG
ncbi:MULTISPECIES: rod shape-determining protein MreC [Ectothiorhodospira]|uniref:Cell shape-determining protein MreC n=1 Tax=Ectothiorhodospira marina TaxID=1396821 RepID=A0A1H7QM94_9GAMM|nr:rod shape-determining protein MreC [Ectothiorhodospira sp. 9100]MCG5518962.1 rod shape-determining protein MreC [Ectothiorhodospira sp. 9905]SEL48357.1 rod shape-determining protein MreC [Ectothiorhodospira marina]